jgi:hypothetical protein
VQALTFLNPTNYVDRVNLQALGTLNSYVDAVQITAVPEPDCGVLALCLSGAILFRCTRADFERIGL